LPDHLRPLLGSIVLHVAIAVVLGLAALFRFAPETPVVRTMEAYVVRGPLRESSRPAPVPAPERAPPTEPPAARPEPAAEPPAPEPVEQPDAAAAREQERLQAREREQAAAQAREAAAQRDAEQRAADAKRRAAEETRKAEAAAAAKRKAEQQAEERRRLETAAKTRAEAEAKRKAELAEKELAERAAREQDDLARRAAAESARAQATDPAALQQYAAEIAARVERNWNRPPTARPGLRCVVTVTQVPGGVVTDAKVGECNGDDAVRQSIVSAVFRASPLPAPPNPAQFQRTLNMVFAPDE
jgi:colicin import membrane protein